MNKIYLTPDLVSVLEKQGITPENYKPAYNGESAGLDLYNAGPEITIFPATNKSLRPNQIFKVLIPTGLHINIPSNYVATIQERGSITKTPLKVRAGIIDSGYSSEIFINCINLSDNVWTVSAGDKLPFQLVVQQICPEWQIVSEQTYSVLTSTNLRQDGKIGSSD